MEGKGIAGIVLLAVGLIFAFAIIPSIASNQAAMTNTVVQVNQSLTAGQFVDSAAFVLKGHDASSVVVINATGNEVITSGNYTIVARVLQSDGNVRSTIIPADAKYNATAVKVSYTYRPDGYIDDSAGRSVASLIVLFVVIALVVFAMWGSNIKEAFEDWM